MCYLFFVRCSLLSVLCHLLFVCVLRFCYLFPVRCSLFFGMCSLVFVRCSVFVVLCSLLVFSLFVAICSWFDV